MLGAFNVFLPASSLSVGATFSSRLEDSLNVFKKIWALHCPGAWLIMCDEANINVFTDLTDLQGLSDSCDRYVGVRGQNPFPSPRCPGLFLHRPFLPDTLTSLHFLHDTKTGSLCHVNISLLHRLWLMRHSSTRPLACLHSALEVLLLYTDRKHPQTLPQSRQD